MFCPVLDEEYANVSEQSKRIFVPRRDKSNHKRIISEKENFVTYIDHRLLLGYISLGDYDGRGLRIR
jgi:hypothetical protein